VVGLLAEANNGPRYPPCAVAKDMRSRHAIFLRPWRDTGVTLV
jgi:hypothetical protein